MDLDRERSVNNERAIPTMRFEGSPPLADAPVAAPPTAARYEIEEEIGTGAMGRVYRAYDPLLRRQVALKFLRDDDAALHRRLLREAAAQARVDHEAVCKVYGVGDLEGRPFIAMQYIKGQTLAVAARELSLEHKVRILKKVAEGVHAAHRLGLIHRDLKPGNILVERTEDGEVKPYVTDFGLARELQEAGGTMTGEVVGTPYYMSPEQARGEVHRLDRRTDVYGLGATAYHVLSGHVPYAASTAGVALGKLLTEEPVPLRRADPRLPPDIETVVMKCLERDPMRRYDSARALAEDLGRFLDGEPVMARRASIAYRLAVMARRNRGAVAAVAAGLAVALIFGGMGLYASRHAAERARLAQELGQEIERVEGTLRHAYMLPLHDPRSEAEVVRRRMRSIEETMRRIGRDAKGPGHYALGRGHLALGEDEKARERLETAWNVGLRTPEVAYALGRALCAIYQRELQLAERIARKRRREERKAELERQYAAPALNYLRAGEGAHGEAPEYVQALLMLCQRRYDEALRAARLAGERVPWLYEARILEGDVSMRRANQTRDVGDYASAMALYQEADAAYGEAIRIGRSDARTYAGRCAAWTDVMFMDVLSGIEDVGRHLAEAAGACDEALLADPDRADVHMNRSLVLTFLGDYEMRYGSRGVDSLRRAVASGQRAVLLDPGNPVAHRYLGTAFLYLGELAPARESYEKALAIDPNDVEAHTDLGMVFRYLQMADLRRGGDGRGAGALAAASFERALGIGGPDPFVLGQLGHLHLDLAYYEDPRCGVEGTRLHSALQHLAASLELNPKLLFVVTAMAHAQVLRAERAFVSGASPLPALEEARPFIYRGLLLNSSNVGSLATLGDLLLLEARFRARKGERPETMFRESRALLELAYAMSPDYPQALSLLESYRREAEWVQSVGRPAADLVERGMAVAEDALCQAPEDPRIRAHRDALISLRAP